MILNDTNFDAALHRSETPVMLFFTSSACGPSYEMQLLIDSVVESIEQGGCEVAEIDIETCPQITRQFQIKGTPTLMLLLEGKPIASRLGTQSTRQLLEWIDVSLSKVG